jgi:protein-S-isoprenylcysteine O-methyltransferase Ste14
MDKRELKHVALIRFSSGAVVLGTMFFGLAGTFRYWEAWAFMAVLFIPVLLVLLYFLRHDPKVLEGRLRAKEDRAQQKTITKWFSIVWMVAFLIPGLDHRYGWSSVPAFVVVLADVLVLAGYFIFFLTLRENRFASRIIRVDEGQTVIKTGPYSVLRHPMYLGVTLMLVFAPLALGSYWAMIPTLTTPLFLALRIVDEEKLLMGELPGYREYTRQTPFRLIPRVW